MPRIEVLSLLRTQAAILVSLVLLSGGLSSSSAIALSQQSVADLPAAVSNAVLQDLSQRIQQPIASFQITRAEQRTWSDGCLGLSEPGTLCTQVLIPGWQVIVTRNHCCWVYRTNQSGSQIKLDTAADCNANVPLELQP